MYIVQHNWYGMLSSNKYIPVLYGNKVSCMPRSFMKYLECWKKKNSNLWRISKLNMYFKDRDKQNWCLCVWINQMIFKIYNRIYRLHIRLLLLLNDNVNIRMCKLYAIAKHKIPKFISQPLFSSHLPLEYPHFCSWHNTGSKQYSYKH